MVKVLIWRVVLYGCETWTLLQDEINRLEALGVWLWRGLEKISWRDKIRNDEVFARVKEERCLIRTIRQRQKNWIEHVLKREGLLRDVMQGRVKETKRPGKPRKGMIRYLKEAFGKKKDEKSDLENRQNKGSREKSDRYVEMRRMAGDRERWRRRVPGNCPRAENH